jgi:NADH:ubiquinone oxidoreductase subunit
MSISKADAKVSISQLGGISGFLRNPGLFLFTLRRGFYVGQDALGNRYFERPGRQKGGRTMRWVVYAGAPEASTVGPEWHAWLHHLTDEPLPSDGRKPWQKPHQPNLTGTQASYRPAGHEYSGGKRAAAAADYEAWTPDQG